MKSYFSVLAFGLEPGAGGILSQLLFDRNHKYGSSQTLASDTASQDTLDACYMAWVGQK